MNALRPLPGPTPSSGPRPLPLDARRGHFDDVLDDALATAGEPDHEARRAGADDPPYERNDGAVPQTTMPPIPQGASPPTHAASHDEAATTTTTTTTNTTIATTTAPEQAAPAAHTAAGAARLGEALQQAIAPDAAPRPTDVKGRLRTRPVATVARAAIGQTTERRPAQTPTPAPPRLVEAMPPRVPALEAALATMPGREAIMAAMAPHADGVPLDVDDAGEEPDVTDAGRPIPVIVDAGPADSGTAEPGALRPAPAPPAALEHLEALLHDPASGVLLDGRAAVVTVDGLKVRIVTDQQGHTSVRMVAGDAALGAALEHQAASLSAGLQGAGLHLEQLQVSRGEHTPDGAGDHHHHHHARDDDAPVPPRRRPAARPTPSPTGGGALAVRA